MKSLILTLNFLLLVGCFVLSIGTSMGNGIYLVALGMIYAIASSMFVLVTFK